VGAWLGPAACLVLGVCGWMTADGLRRAGAGLGLERAHLPWDANRLPETATEAEVLALRPVSPFARFRDALSRADTTGEGSAERFQVACRGVLRWGRNQPGTLLELGRVALHRGLTRDEPATRALALDLLRAYVVRTTHSENESVRAWAELAPATDDAFAVWSLLPPRWWSLAGVTLVPSHPEGAWRLLAPDLERGTLDPRYAGPVLDLARKRRQPADAAVLRSLAARADLAPGTVENLRAFVAELERVR